jgi:isopenicillin-N N-acyltransferase-like protein
MGGLKMKSKRVLRVIECKGTPYEIGQQYGEGCRDSILKSMEINLVFAYYDLLLG